MRERHDRFWLWPRSPRSKSSVRILCFLLIISGGAGIQAGGQVQSSRFEFGLIGDQQYSAEMEANFPNLMRELNAANLAFVVHDGDIKSGTTRCSDELFYSRRDEFQTSKHPFIYTPGDNEWTDCHRAEAGSYDPLERLTKLREVFFQGDQGLGQRTLPLTRQSHDPKYAKYRENVRWTFGEVLFVTLHIVGSNNNLGRTPQADSEFAERNVAVLEWMKQAFELAKRDGSRGIMLIMQANPRFEDTWPAGSLRGLRMTAPDPTRRSGFSDFLKALETETVAFGKPVVLVHGDTHYFRIDKPLLSSATQRKIENFTRVETFGAPDVHWVRVIVDPNDPNIFTFKPEIVQANVVGSR